MSHAVSSPSVIVVSPNESVPAPDLIGFVDFDDVRDDVNSRSEVSSKRNPLLSGNVVEAFLSAIRISDGKSRGTSVLSLQYAVVPDVHETP
jgi:hypothetical protein